MIVTYNWHWIILNMEAIVFILFTFEPRRFRQVFSSKTVKILVVINYNRCNSVPFDEKLFWWSLPDNSRRVVPFRNSPEHSWPILHFFMVIMEKTIVDLYCHLNSISYRLLGKTWFCLVSIFISLIKPKGLFNFKICARNYQSLWGTFTHFKISFR